MSMSFHKFDSQGFAMDIQPYECWRFETIRIINGYVEVEL